MDIKEILHSFNHTTKELLNYLIYNVVVTGFFIGSFILLGYGEGLALVAAKIAYLVSFGQYIGITLLGFYRPGEFFKLSRTSLYVGIAAGLIGFITLTLSLF